MCSSDLQPLSFYDKSKALTLFALVTFYYSMDGENWYDRANNNWLNSDVDLCDWQGVNCKLPDRQYSYYEEKEKAAAAAAALEYEEGSYREVGIDERNGKRKLLRHRKISDATPEYVFDLTDKNVDLYEYYEEPFPIDSLVLNANNLCKRNSMLVSDGFHRFPPCVCPVSLYFTGARNYPHLIFSFLSSFCN